MDTDVLVLGGGLSGLAIARQLDLAGRDFILVEARDRLGGRVKSVSRLGGRGTSSHRYDLGPAWFWPGQERMALLVRELGLQTFEQYSSGHLVFEDEAGDVRRNLTFATMGGALRLADGVASLTDALACQLPARRIRLQHAVRHLRLIEGGVEANFSDSQQCRLRARYLVCAVPPRLVAETVSFEPALTTDQQLAMKTIPTWMAGHAKVVVIYDRPLWRDHGLSGDGISRRGPLAEIHDASPSDVSEGALFGFVGIAANARTGLGDGLKRAATEQLVRMFGPCAAEPRHVLTTDWAIDRFTATTSDADLPEYHFTYGLPRALRDLWHGRILLASTETAAQFGGYLEGALEAAEATCHRLRVGKAISA